MTLPAPNLDDRRFQDLVDEAKRFVQQRCPEWTDHNVSDPGVTMIELFATMVDQLVYRLNRVPDRNYVKFLELIGVHRLPPTDADTEVTFWLSRPQPVTVRIDSGTEVATGRSGTEEPIVFSVVEELDIVPCSVARVATSHADRAADRTDQLGSGKGFPCFAATPQPDDALLVGLTQAVPRCAVVLRVDCSSVEGHGIDPTNPPLVWEAWNGDSWVSCQVEQDGTGGFNKAGDVRLHVPRGHTVSVLARHRAAWIRCRVIERTPDEESYKASPVIARLAAATIGGTTSASHAELIDNEVLGTSEGVAGQRFSVKRPPVVASGQPLVLEVSGDEGWEQWTQVAGFAGSRPGDRHFVLEAIDGEIVLGPAVREPDGGLRQYGAVPPKGAALRVRQYRTGGGARGNVARGAIRVLKSSLPYVSRVENRVPAAGGVDAESLEAAKIRGPVLLRTRDRAVTTEDYEHLALEAAPELAQVRCVAADDAGAGAVRLMIVPALGGDGSAQLRLEQLVPSEALEETIKAYLLPRMVLGARLVIEPFSYQGLTVRARLKATSGVRAASGVRQMKVDALAALHRYLSPKTGGPDGGGWTPGRSVHVGEVYSVLQRVPGVDSVEEVALVPVDPSTGRRTAPVARLELEPNNLVFSYAHEVDSVGAARR